MNKVLSVFLVPDEVLEVELRGSAPKTCTIITRGKAKESWAGVMALNMLRTRPRLQTNALQGTAGQGRGSGAQKGDCCCEECGDGGGACSRTPPPSPVVHQTCTGDVTRAARGSDAKLRAFFLHACQSSRRPWHLLKPRHHVLRDGPVARLCSVWSV